MANDHESRIKKVEKVSDRNKVRINALYWVFGVVVLTDIIARIFVR